MSLFPSGEFTSLFRLLDDYDVHRSGRGGHPSSNTRAFRPKFDVRELKDTYELHGELPGVDQKDVNIEFVDPHTMVIAGRVERSVSRGTPPASIAHEPSKGQPKSSHKATVEDEGAESAVRRSGAANSSGTAPAEEPEYWVTERSIGEFHRSFTFPSKVDQDAVKANLKNGILNVVVPKLTASVSKKIRID
jgi:HSP20 family molecular chaperone IbpA